MSTITTPLLIPNVLPAWDLEQVERFRTYSERFRDLFSRAEQARCFGFYLRGLLEGNHRKNVESIAERLKGMRGSENTGNAADLAQSLQHFISHSPWDAGQVLQRYRQKIRPLAISGEGVLVVHDAIFPKTGSHSVGVQRQYARHLGRKVNCQVGVVVSYLGENGYYPLAIRLYLPAFWLREHFEQAQKSIPEAYRTGASKIELALQLLEELQAEGWGKNPIISEDGYSRTPGFQEGLVAKNLRSAERTHTADEIRTQLSEQTHTPHQTHTLLATALKRFDWLKDQLGLNHFEGRNWMGWHHHVSLVFAAYGFLADDNRSEQLPPFASRNAGEWTV